MQRHVFRAVEHDGKIYTEMTVDDLLAYNVPQAVIDAAISAERREEIKAECRRRIYGKASAESQMNINGAAALAGAKTASQRSDEETALLSAHALALQWIMDMRAAVEALDADPDADFLADTAWPECPADVVAMVSAY